MTASATLATAAPFATCDLCDAHKDGQTLRVLPPVFRTSAAVAASAGR